MFSVVDTVAGIAISLGNPIERDSELEKSLFEK